VIALKYILVHSALTLTVYLDNPAVDPNTDALFVYHGTKNIRSKLKEEWSGRGGFPGYGISFSPFCIPVSAVAAAMSKGEKNALLTTALQLKAEYGRQSSYGAIGTAIVKLMEFMVTAAKNGLPYVYNQFSSCTMH